MGKVSISIIALFWFTFTAHAAEMQVKFYQFENVAQKKNYLYAVLLTQDSAQILNCAEKKLSPDENVEKFLAANCSTAIPTNLKGNEGMVNVIKDQSLVSFHMGGTKKLALQGLSTILSGKVKSWLAVFSLDLKNDSDLLFTGSGIEISDGTPRMDAVRISLKKISETSLESAIPLISFLEE